MFSDRFFVGLKDAIIDGVHDEIAELGLDSRKYCVSHYDGEDNVPLRVVFNKQCSPIIDNVYHRVVDYLEDAFKDAEDV